MKLRDRSPGEAAERIRFTSSIPPRWARRTPSLEALLPVLYLRGVSMGDFQEALGTLLGKDAPNLSPAVASHRYLTCVPDSRRALAGFLFQFLRTPAGVAQIQAVSPGSAERNRTLSTKGLANVRVPLPPLDEQRRIVARLDTVSARLNTNPPSR